MLQSILVKLRNLSLRLSLCQVNRKDGAPTLKLCKFYLHEFTLPAAKILKRSINFMLELMGMKNFDFENIP